MNTRDRRLGLDATETKNRLSSGAYNWELPEHGTALILVTLWLARSHASAVASEVRLASSSSLSSPHNQLLHQPWTPRFVCFTRFCIYFLLLSICMCYGTVCEDERSMCRMDFLPPGHGFQVLNSSHWACHQEPSSAETDHQPIIYFAYVSVVPYARRSEVGGRRSGEPQALVFMAWSFRGFSCLSLLSLCRITDAGYHTQF